MAAAIYFFISSLMSITVYGARAHKYSREFHLTTSQRSLMLQSILYMAYLLLGARVYSHIEGWNFLDAVYWADFTILTDGIGNLTPRTHLGRGLLFPYAAGGILILALLIRSICSFMIERGKKKIVSRTTERLRSAVSRRLRSGSKGRWPLLPDRPGFQRESEHESKKQEFYLMRRIHQTEALYLRWYSLVTSLLVWMSLWLFGALAFFFAERKAQWTYFQSLYFAYTSLLTIGYGDFALGAVWSKPFFVLWSLLAIPTTTIFFSAFGDTLARTFHDLAIYIGELTILPGEIGIKKQALHSYQSVMRNFRQPSHILSQPSPNETQKNQEVANYYEKEFVKLKGDEDRSPQNRTRRQYLLCREMRKVHGDIARSPPKEYTYEEWCFFLQLVRRLNSCCRLTDVPPECSGETRDHGAFSPSFLLDRWSWIGIHTPLMGDKDEAEWLFDGLSSTLGFELEFQYRNAQESTLSQYSLH
ncbi:hypothetical protein LOZ65_006417 [Ophidiomyces ophidiicola]|nr:hypothetical protein LOZ65_006417 [Ophidiomyces ophidiicola]